MYSQSQCRGLNSDVDEMLCVSFLGFSFSRVFILLCILCSQLNPVHPIERKQLKAAETMY